MSSTRRHKSNVLGTRLVQIAVGLIILGAVLSVAALVVEAVSDNTRRGDMRASFMEGCLDGRDAALARSVCECGWDRLSDGLTANRLADKLLELQDNNKLEAVMADISLQCIGE